MQKLILLPLCLLMLTIQHSFAYSLSGQPSDDFIPVPASSIRQANAVYFYHRTLINDLFTLDSLNREHHKTLDLKISLLNQENIINEDIIHNLNQQLNNHKSINKSLVWQNRLLWGGVLLLSSYVILK